MDLGVERKGRDLDLSFMEERGPRCHWQGDDLVLLDRVIGGVHREVKGAWPWLMRVDHLAAAFGIEVADRDVVLQMAVDAKAIGADEAADGLADCVRFPALTPAEIAQARPRLSWRTGRQSRVAYEIKHVWHEEDHPRHPAGAPDSAGGEFALKPTPMSDRVSRRPSRERAEPRIARLRTALAVRRDLSAREQLIYGRIAEAEGVDRGDSGSTAFAGILQETLEAAQRRHPSLRRFRSTTQLTDEAIITVYKDYFDDIMQSVGGSRAIDEVDTDCAATAMMDTLFRHGRGNGATLLQQAIADTWFDVFPDSTPPLIASGFGPATFGAYNALVHGGYAAQLTRRLAERRRGAPRVLPSEGRRFDRFVCSN